MECKKTAVILFLFFLAINNVLAGDEVDFSVSEWDYGIVMQGEILSKELVIRNHGSKPLSLELIPTCDCIFSEPQTLNINPRGNGAVNLFFDTTEYSGEVIKTFIIQTNKKGFEQITFQLHGFVVTSRAEKIEEQNEAAGVSTKNILSDNVEIFYYYSAGCKHCLSFLNETVPNLEKKMNISISVIEKDILNPMHFEEFNKKISQLGEKSRGFPALIIGSKVLQGESEIDTHIELYLNNVFSKEGSQPEKTQEDIDGGDVVADTQLALVPVIFAGLLDGINPCAFSTLIFLLAYLAYVGRRKQEILIIGIFYTLTVFISYFLIGLGFFRFLRLADSFPLVSKIIEFLLMGVLIAFAGISLYDYVLIKKGRTKDIVLQLPDSLKQRIRTSIRTQAKSTAIILSSIVLGFLVSVFELACTGQIYFPTIAYMIQMKEEVLGYFYLSVYNFGFIFPLLVIFFLTYKGLSSERLTKIFQAHLAKIKLITAIFFIGLALIVIFM